MYPTDACFFSALKYTPEKERRANSITTALESNLLKLTEYTTDHEQSISSFYLPEEQLQFTRYPIEKITDPALPESTHHILIVNGDTPVGYFALEDGDKLGKYTNNSKARLLTSFSIDSKDQGKGYAKQGLSLLPTFIFNNLPYINEVVLGVNKKNKSAIGLYKKTGFIDNNEVIAVKKALSIFYI
ncbi:GNAT family N-acetyltransferase [Halobacillus shinanisalinarum]|uniref:GNAT family N-acetyltransferase n=1 Tax=Halobacillus shinanisalinarum TaxID=2932258 RepID=A0ABY4H1Z0_9BACI|nr:GNAT family N-acetyltransferase [Halobacillus shinanisalinarum]UOQ94170.1 GNAT family N-acetyltransferase [Halobacillus shinanisalinarum]